MAIFIDYAIIPLFWYFVVFSIPVIIIAYIEDVFKKRKNRKYLKDIEDEHAKRLINILRNLSQEERSKIEDIKPGLLRKVAFTFRGKYIGPFPDYDVLYSENWP